MNQVQLLPSPTELGLPSKFDKWRPGQDQAIIDGIECETPFLGQMAPPGFGKSPTYIGQALITGDRTMILTATKGLQDQLLEDFGDLGLTDIRGKSSYQCESNPAHTCEEGSAGKCCYKGSSMCPWSAAKFAIMGANLGVTNYSCWIASIKYGTGLGSFGRLVLDEAHNAPEELARAMQIVLSHKDVEETLSSNWPEPREREDMLAWKRWAAVLGMLAEAKTQELADKIKKDKKPASSTLRDFRHMRNLRRKLADLALCKAESWVYDEHIHGFQFDPLDPAEYGQRVLFNKIPKVVLTSATIRPKTLGMLGISREDSTFIEYPGVFRPAKSPVYYIPTVKMHYNMTSWDLKQMVNRVDEILDGRLDRKGVIHTPSFKLRDAVMNMSRHKRFMTSNYTKEGDVTSEVVDRFKKDSAPSFLVSPSVSTGYDFLGDTCRFQIITKIPFPNEQSKVDKRRKELDPERGLYKASMQLTQAVGRGQRSEDDWQEVFVLDDNADWFMRRAEKYLPADFRAKYRVGGKRYTVPPAPEI